MGWLTVASYALAAWLCWRALTLREGMGDSERSVWRALCPTMVALGLNKQLDLQSALTEVGRMTLRSLDLYAYKQVTQLSLIASVAIAGLIVTAWLLRRAQKAPRATQIALYGFASVVVFVGIRAASFHHIDRLIGLDPGGIRLNWVFELGGLSVLCLGAYFRSSSSS
jgi:hypothetical protein